MLHGTWTAFDEPVCPIRQIEAHGFWYECGSTCTYWTVVRIVALTFVTLWSLSLDPTWSYSSGSITEREKERACPRPRSVKADHHLVLQEPIATSIVWFTRVD